MSSEIVWKSPPLSTPRRADVVAAQLLARPGEWAMIATSPALELLPWWGPIYNDERFEVRFVRVNPDHPSAVREVYARYRAVPVGESE